MKKIKCIKTGGLEELTLNKEYEVIAEDMSWYRIMNDNGLKDGYQKHLFEEVKRDNELNIIEAMKMPTETIFEVYYKNGNKDARSAKVLEVFDGKCKKRLVWDNRVDINVVVTESILNAIFIPISQPVKGVEAITSGNKIKVDHYLTRGIYEFNDYMDFNIMCRFLYNFENSEVIKIINEGLWYIKEDISC